MVGKRGLGILGVLSAIAGLGVASSTQAQPIVGVPHDWQMNFPPAYTPLMEKVESLNDLLLIIISLICAFVAALIIYAVWRFHASRNPVATTTTHNTVIEIAWTVLPILILVIIAIPSFRLLYYGDKATDAAFTVKVTGHQWYWSYEYPDQGNFSIDSRILSEADRVKQADSMHGWTVPGFGIKKTVIPGRLNEGWINVRDEGFYFGQCSQICGNNHTYMPIAVRVVSKPEFDNWVEQTKKSAGLVSATDVASATPPANR